MSSDCDESCDGQWQTKCLDTPWPIWERGFFTENFCFEFVSTVMSKIVGYS